MSTQPTTLVLGATGSIGYAVTQNLLTRGLPVTILVRNRAKADALFSGAPTLTILEGDVQDADTLKQVAAGKQCIVHGINYPYDEWLSQMEPATRNVVEAASQNQATIVFPGNVYTYGNCKDPIREDSRPAPNTRKGALRVALEDLLEKAAQAGKCRVLTVRLPDFWGPNVLNAGVKPVFEGALQGKALPWLLNADIPHQFVYTPDAAEIMVRLMLRGSRQPYEVWNYGGEVVPSVRWLFGRIAAITGQSLKIKVYPKWLFSVLGLFVPMMRELKEMFYLYENSVVLDDAKVRAEFPDVNETSLDIAITDTLTWFARHQLQQEFAPAIRQTVGTSAAGKHQVLSRSIS
ncbi:NAD(P)H-binding protein [Nibrella viscosa]|uniref:NAD(P)H-binding protein n=1 Tax=Nibrella viscosa TaxID=1084524 RepID=A0ABP8JTA3_9BACT